MTFLYRTAAVLAVLACMLATMFASPGNAQAPERRFALVIGNSEYRAGKQPTAANDAGLISLLTIKPDLSIGRDPQDDFCGIGVHRLLLLHIVGELIRRVLRGRIRGCVAAVTWVRIVIP